MNMNFPGIPVQRIREEKSKAQKHDVFGNLCPAFAGPRVIGVLGDVQLGKQIT